MYFLLLDDHLLRWSVTWLVTGVQFYHKTFAVEKFWSLVILQNQLYKLSFTFYSKFRFQKSHNNI